MLNISFINWLNSRDNFEKVLWNKYLEKNKLLSIDLDVAYQQLLDDFKKIERNDLKISNINTTPNNDNENKKIILKEIAQFTNINAIEKESKIRFNDQLTIIFGTNGSGKSGICRLLSNVCFSRGTREILPNLRDEKATKSYKENNLSIGANFTISVNNRINTIYCDQKSNNYNDLKKFQFFDYQSVLEHLNNFNSLNFIPAQIKMYKEVSDAVTKVEEKLKTELEKKRINNSLDILFKNEPLSETITQLQKITHKTNKDKLKAYLIIDQELLIKKEKELERLKKIDTSLLKKKFLKDQADIFIFLKLINSINLITTSSELREINNKTRNFNEKKLIVDKLLEKQFKSLSFSVKTEKWKSFLQTANELYIENQNSLNTAEKCILCQQSIENKKDLFSTYFQFLNSKAENEFKLAENEIKDLISKISNAIIKLEKMDDKYHPLIALNEQDQALHFITAKNINNHLSYLVNLKQKIEDKENITEDQKEVETKNIITFLTKKEKEINETKDLSKTIEILENEITNMIHKKKASSILDNVLEYIDYLVFEHNVNQYPFKTIKAQISNKSSSTFNDLLKDDYVGIFNGELDRLSDGLDLVLKTSSQKGDPKKTLKLKFASDFNASEILSEGEQKVAALADFFSEAKIDKSVAGLIFDDPTTSLDHEKKESIAKRIVEEAQNRQVIVFTHDIKLLSLFFKFINKYNVNFKTNWIKKENGKIGVIYEDRSPNTDNLASIKNDIDFTLANLSEDPKKKEGEILLCYGFLRKAHEALIEESLFANCVNRYRDSVQVGKLDLTITDETIVDELIQNYEDISQYIDAHNRSMILNESSASLNSFKEEQKRFFELESKISVLKKEKNKKQKKKRDNLKKITFNN